MKNESVGKVTWEERDTIRSLYQRKLGLLELLPVMETQPADNLLYEKIVKDLGDTKLKMDGWWQAMSQKYKWKSTPDGSWNIDFDTCEVNLIYSATE